MSFLVGRNYTPAILIAIALLGSGTYYLIDKTQSEERLKAEKSAARIALKDEQTRIHQENQQKVKAEKSAQLAAQEAEKEVQRRAKQKAEAERNRLAKVLAEQLEAEKLEAENRQREREVAWARYIGTKYASLKVAGKTYNDVTVIKASAIGVTIAYEHGARQFKYEDLSSQIRELCHYDAEISMQALIAEQKTKQRSAAKPQQAYSSSRSSKPTKKESQKKSSPLPKIAPTPRGSITARIAAQRSGHSSYYYRDGKKYSYHFKTIQVTARANVAAKLYNNGSYIGSVTPDQSAQFTTKSDNHGKYRLELKSTSGRLLDSEAWNRKSGLGGSSGL